MNVVVNERQGRRMTRWTGVMSLAHMCSIVNSVGVYWCVVGMNTCNTCTTMTRVMGNIKMIPSHLNGSQMSHHLRRMWRQRCTSIVVPSGMVSRTMMSHTMTQRMRHTVRNSANGWDIHRETQTGTIQIDHVHRTIVTRLGHSVSIMLHRTH